MIKKLILLFFLFCTPLSAITLIETLQQAQSGDFVGLQQRQMISLVRVASCDQEYLYLEQLSIPAPLFCGMNLSLREWYAQGAAKKCAHSILKINFNNRSCETCSGAPSASPHLHGWLCTLLNLPFEPVPSEMRKKVASGETWNPRVIVDGCPIEPIDCMALTAQWPEDQSPLSHRRLDIYLPHATPNASYPLFFPYFIEIEGKVSCERIRVIDSGKNL